MSSFAKGFINYVTVAIVLFLTVGGWAGFNFAKAYYSKAKLEEISQTILFSKWRSGPEKVREEIFSQIQSFPQVIASEDNVSVEQREGTSIFVIRIRYEYQVIVPLWNKKLLFPIETIIEKNLSLQKSLSY